jgi:hypothetical protein
LSFAVAGAPAFIIPSASIIGDVNGIEASPGRLVQLARNHPKVPTVTHIRKSFVTLMSMLENQH